MIDGGININHEDLMSVLWINPKEIAGNGRDDDRNGYVDDLHGWNFLGSKDGRNIEREQREETRLYARLKPLYYGESEARPTRVSLTPTQQRDYELWKVVKPYFERKRAEKIKNYKITLVRGDLTNSTRFIQINLSTFPGDVVIRFASDAPVQVGELTQSKGASEQFRLPGPAEPSHRGLCRLS